jgi:hypothetical protein
MAAVTVLFGVDFSEGIEQILEGCESIRAGVGGGEVGLFDSIAGEDFEPADAGDAGAGTGVDAGIFPAAEGGGFDPAADGIEELSFEKKLRHCVFCPSPPPHIGRELMADEFELTKENYYQ